MPKRSLAYLLTVLLLALAVLMSGCGQATAAASGGGVNPVADAGNNPAATATPFLPNAPTPTSSSPLFPTATPRYTPTPTLYAIPNTNGSGTYPQAPGYVPPQAPHIQQPENQINILILGSDQRPYTGGYRTDVILMVTVNFEKKTINMTSFPRDLYVYMPGYYQERINATQFKGGFELTAATFEYNFGVRPDYFVMLNFSGFESIINMMGGIDVNVAQTLTDQRTGYGYYTVYAGVRHMDGATALWYVRSRYTTSDFDRTRRQQEVLLAFVDRMIALDMIPRIPDLYTQYQNTVTTDLALEDIIPLIPLAPEFLKGNIGRYAIGRDQITSAVTPNGSAVLLPNTAAIQAVLRMALNAN